MYYGKIEILWHENSMFSIKMPSDRVLLIDLWITSVANRDDKKQWEEKKVDLMLLTHVHDDYIRNVVDMAKNQSKICY